MGYVYYGNYAAYFEVARTEAMRQIGLSYKLMEEAGVMMPVIRLCIDYRKPAVYDDLLTIALSIEKMPGVKMLFTYEVFNQQNQLLCTAETTLVFVDAQNKKPVMCPPLLANTMRPFFNR